MAASQGIRTAIVLAAGEGTRLRPITFTRPKPLIPILGKPFISHILENLSKAGIRRAIVVIGYRGEEIRKYLEENSKKLGLKIDFVTQARALGTGHAFAAAAGLLAKSDERFLCLAGDNYYSAGDIADFVKKAEKEAGFLVGGIDVLDPGRFGIFSLEGERVTKVIEKPANPPSNTANASLYLFDKSCLDLAGKLEKSPRGEYEITDVLKILAGRNLLNFSRLSYWTDLGAPWDILDLNAKLLSEMKGKIHSGAEIERGAHIKGAVLIGKGTIVKSGSYIEGPVWIGEDCSIGPNCYIRAGTVLGEKTGVGQAVEIKNSVFFGHTNVKHLSYVADSVIGKNCNFGAGTITANLRHDKGNIKMVLNGKLVDSGRRKLGVVMGDNSKTGIHCSVYPGRTIGPNSWTDSASLVDRDVPPGHFLRRDGTIEKLP
ncbi:MAG: bifunctional sugar-1-phosphate nucleotidylyltransferase/acetyltransferase [archaeon]